MKRGAPSQSGSRSKKKQKDVPRRPLSAYNLYFKLVRPVLIESHERGEKQADFDTHLENSIKAGKSKAQGAVFQAASRTLAERWKTMSAAERQPFEEQAQQEMKKYRVQLEAYERKKAAEEKSGTKSAGIKMKEAPKKQPPAGPPRNSGGEISVSSAGTTTKGVKQQQPNLSDSEGTTISSKSGPSVAQVKVFVQQPSGDSDSLGKQRNNNINNACNNLISSDLLSRVDTSNLLNQISGGNSANQSMNEELVRGLTAAAALESLLADPVALLLLLVVLLLQANSNQSQPQAPAPTPNPTMSLLASLVQNNMNSNTTQTNTTPQQTYTTIPQVQTTHNWFSNQVPTPSPPIVQDDVGQASLLEKLSQLSDGEREVLKKLVETKLGLSQSQAY
eukprot:scaffold6026_cov163-Amphora_coffeaeformis.AAC.14